MLLSGALFATIAKSNKRILTFIGFVIGVCLGITLLNLLIIELTRVLNHLGVMSLNTTKQLSPNLRKDTNAL